jgi:hypothetical protein
MDIAGPIFIVGVSTIVFIFARRARKRRESAGRAGGSDASEANDAGKKPVKLVTDQQALTRLRCFRLMSVRSELEQMIAAVPAENGELRATVVAVASEQWAQIAAPALLEQCSEEERHALGHEVGTWALPQIVDASWRTESAAVLAWALGYASTMPAYDEQGVPKEVFANVDRAPPRLRSATELGAARGLAELWHWRARTLGLQRSGEPVRLPPGYTLEKVVAQTAGLSQQKGWFRPIGDDFPAFGKPYRELDDDQMSVAMSIAMERHRAFNWLCGYAVDWDDVPTDT